MAKTNYPYGALADAEKLGDELRLVDGVLQVRIEESSMGYMCMVVEVENMDVKVGLLACYGVSYGQWPLVVRVVAGA